MQEREVWERVAATLTVDLSNLPLVTNPSFQRAFQSTDRFLVLYGGAGSGKSVAAAQKLLVRILVEDKHRILCCRSTAASVTKSQFPQLTDLIEDYGLEPYFDIYKAAGRERIKCKHNGNEIIFSGLDDVTRLKSITGITSIWVEEASEIAQKDFQELDRRLRGYRGRNAHVGYKRYMQIILTFNPISVLHWLKKYFVDNPPPSTLVMQSTYKDNRFIDDNYARVMERLQEDDPYEYRVYALGEWGIVGGGYFDGQAVATRIDAIKEREPLRQGYYEYVEHLDHLSNITWVDDPDGAIRIYREAAKGYPYVLGADTAGGGSDYNVGQVVCNITGQQMATVRQQFDEDLFAHQLYCLGKEYNEALAGIETNFSTHPMQVLRRLQYARQYIRESAPDAYTGHLADKFGFLTHKANRGDMLGRLRSLVRSNAELINDLTTLEEMTTFVRNEQGKPEASRGCHDDCIMALAIAHAIREQQSMEITAEVFDLSKLPQDLQDDYYNADEATKRYLLIKWGFLKEAV